MLLVVPVASSDAAGSPGTKVIDVDVDIVASHSVSLPVGFQVSASQRVHIESVGQATVIVEPAGGSPDKPTFRGRWFLFEACCRVPRRGSLRNR